VRFHGQIPHLVVPKFIAAADLCLAPYQASAFYHGLVTFSTLKIPEYMACERPVVSIPSGNIQRLISEQCSGFLFPNDVFSWKRFLRDMPSRSRLREMGKAAAQSVASISWQNTAARYLEISQRLVTK
jgi:glycosyltransferase involved in cell wall biosynthesis